MKLLLAAMCCASLVLLSCANSKPQEKEPLKTTSSLQSPLKVSFTEVSRTSTTATLHATVERVLGIHIPFAARIEFPPGVRLMKGRSTFDLPPNAEATTVTETLVLEFDALPTSDATFFVDGESEAMGFHYSIPYRFGRPAPVVEAPAATGPSVKHNGKDLGPSIPLK
jgi:hypothetical protein